jgi:hypothetical protein
MNASGSIVPNAIGSALSLFGTTVVTATPSRKKQAIPRKVAAAK